LKGQSTRQIVGCIEMDGAVKVEHASLVWKSAFKNLGLTTHLSHCSLQNIDANINVFKCTPASEILLNQYFWDVKYILKW